MNWTTKEKFCLLFDILEFGDQNESWIQISNDLNRKFLSNSKFSIKNCKQEYRILVDQYKSRWIDEEEKCSNQRKMSLVKFIFKEFKTIYLNELISQIKESRKKILDMCLQLEPTINLKSHRNDSFQIPSAVEIAPDVSFESQPIEQIEEKVRFELPTENVNVETTKIEETTNDAQQDSLSSIRPVEETKVEDPIEIKIDVPVEPTPIKEEESTTTTENSSSNEENIPIESNENVSSVLPSAATNGTSFQNVSSSTGKYHIYFCPNSSTNSSNGTNKGKAKRKNIEEKKEEDDVEPSIPSESVPSTPTSQNETSKSNMPMTLRSTPRSTPNLIAEQEEEKSRRFSAMLLENPNSWQSQANSIIQYLLSQKQGYLFKDEITDEIAPKYHQFIRRPIALDTIRKNLESNFYTNKEHFKRDIFLMLYNAMKYNPRHHHVHRSAKHLFLQTLPLFNLSNEDIQGQIVRRNSTQHNDLPPAKRKRIK